MKSETQKELLEVSKKALMIISVDGRHSDFVFKLRDLIRKCESEDKDERESNS